ncbi:hypothetical protein BDW67DRAFT_163091 [Aspergillus spinulosporus]
MLQRYRHHPLLYLYLGYVGGLRVKKTVFQLKPSLIPQPPTPLLITVIPSSVLIFLYLLALAEATK